MNLDSLSFALAEISYLVANLTKKNFRSSVAEINHVSYGSDCLFFYIGLQSAETISVLALTYILLGQRKGGSGQF